ncbi:TRAP transporter substrate-binding protein [Agrococcus carbonis]|uniref:TRAP-type C4-dicarboxylate transport system, substrate-binding protein n=1 Tax=Agrococcus carbonis TaxID=684552 RepID=A0A1H1SRJ8_9MICO|nr:hypothetical protein [Agrococcus carbonis]SDS50551.1 TRAP-type C4-dicarboxylate transport system, substrate-binding protein [Agrococcus carbonis]
MHPSSGRPASVAAGLLAAAALTGCTASEVGIAGFAEPVIHLEMGVADPPGRFSFDAAEEFAARVEAATGGDVDVAVRRFPEDGESPGWNQVLAGAALDGELDLALVHASAWDALGVDTLRVLQVPFLVADEEALDAIATSDLADALLAGIEPTGATPLALVPGGMRHLFGDGSAALRPADLAGASVRAPRSEDVWATIEALGAEPREDGPQPWLDSMFALADAFYDAPTTAGDVATHPLAFALVGNDDALDALSPAHREAIASAARDTAAWAAESRPTDAAEARAMCARNPGARVVLAGAEARAEWRAAVADRVAELRASVDLDRLADRIERLQGGLGVRAEPVAACSGAASAAAEPTTAPTPVASDPGPFPEGHYRREVSAADLEARGVHRSDAAGHAGVWDLLLRDGVFGPPEGSDCPGSTYRVDRDVIVVELGPAGPGCGEAAGRVLFSARWALEDDALVLTDVRSGHGSDLLIQGIFGGGPWTRIG